MTDLELDKLLRAARIPLLEKDFKKTFPKTVLSLLRSLPQKTPSMPPCARSPEHKTTAGVITHMTPVGSKPVKSEKSTPYDASSANILKSL